MESWGSDHHRLVLHDLLALLVVTTRPPPFSSKCKVFPIRRGGLSATKAPDHP